MQEIIGKIVLDYSYYPGEDLYSDGKVEDELLDIAKNSSPETLNATIAESKSWPVMYHFSHIRQNILEWLPIKKSDNVLEIGSGCGAITGALARKAGSVRCIELSKKRSYINAYRNQAYDNIRIDVGNFQDIEKDLTETFDYITLIGVFEYARGYIGGNDPYVDMLKKISRHLKPGGKLVIAIENRLGLKYWAGCSEDHAGMYFEGLEGYHNFTGAKTFSKKELNDIVARAGGLHGEYYYPYPDYKFPMTIFSDHRLPGQGELNQNICNFDRERLQVFDETKVYDTLLDSGLFPEFSNSFLLLLSREEAEEEEKAIYVKYSNERSDDFSIRTDIMENKNGERSVRKCAYLPAGQKHIEHLVRYFKELGKLYEGTPLCLNQVQQDQEGVRFAYIQGSTLEEEMDTLLQQKQETEAKSLMMQYLETVKGLAGDKEFQMTEEFSKVFGSQKLPEGLKALPLADIDLVLSNILVHEGWNVIDYEWTFEFPVPVNYVLYRIIHYYQTQDLRKCVENWELYEQMGISAEEIPAYESMEQHFQAYIQGNHVAIRDLYEEITPGLLNVYTMAFNERKKRMDERLQVFFAGDEEFAEEDSSYYAMPDGRIQICLAIPENTKKVRIDPSSYSGILTIKKLSYGESQEKVEFISNGYALSDDRILFDSLDPQLHILNLPQDVKNLQIDFVMDMASAEVGAIFREMEELPAKKDAEIAHLKDLLSLREEQIRQMENTKVWKAYKKIKGKR